MGRNSGIGLSASETGIGGLGAGTGFLLFTQADNNPGIYADAAARDVYFTANPDDLARLDANEFLIIKLLDDGAGEIAYQQRDGGAFVDVTSLVQGETGAAGATGNSYFFSSVPARDAFFSTPGNEGLLETDLPVIVNLGQSTTTTFVWVGETAPVFYDPGLWRVASQEVSSGTLFLGEGGASISSGNEVLNFINASATTHYIHGVEYDDAGSEPPTFWVLDPLATVPLSDVFDTTLADPQEISLTNVTNAYVKEYTLIPATTGNLRVQTWLGPDDTGPVLVDSTFVITGGMIGVKTTFKAPNDTLVLIGQTTTTRFSGVQLDGGLQTTGPFTGQTIPLIDVGVWNATDANYATTAALLAEGSIPFAGADGVFGSISGITTDGTNLDVSGRIDGAGAGGLLDLKGADNSPTGGPVRVRGGGASNVGGKVELIGGSGTNSGGNIELSGGEGPNTTGGSVISIAGNAGSDDGSGVGGDIVQTAGNGGFDSGAAGNVVITAGSGNINGGDVVVTGGAGTTSEGGTVFIAGGASTDSAGGTVDLTAGNAGSTGAGGNIVLLSGSASGSGEDSGAITIDAGITVDGNVGDILMARSTGSVGIGVSTVVASAQLEVSSASRGFLPPRMTTAERDNISSPAPGLQIHNITTNRPEFFDGSAWAGTAGNETLAETLANGNTTGGTDLIISSGDVIQGAPGAGPNDNGLAVNIIGGVGGATSGNGGAIFITGKGGNTNNSSGGSITIATGDGGSASGDGGNLIITTGSTSSGDGGDFTATLGTASTANRTGGGFVFTPGAGTGVSPGGGFIVNGATGGPTGSGSGIVLNAGDGGATSGIGGGVTLNAGAGGGSGVDGLIRLLGGDVGIGTSTPSARLTVKEDSSNVATNIVSTIINEDTTASNWAELEFATLSSVASEVTGVRLGAQYLDHTNASIDADFVIKTTHNNILSERFRISDGVINVVTGDLSIGTGNIVSPDGASGVNIDITSGAGTAGAGGALNLTAGNGTFGAGDINVLAGSTTTSSGTGGQVNIQGGTGIASTTGGNTLIFAGTGGAVGGQGGLAAMHGGDGAGTGNGGAVEIEAGASGVTSGNGGDVTITSGSGSTNAGHLSMVGGDGTFAGGDISLLSGNVAGTGIAGLISLQPGISGGASPGGQVKITGGVGGDASGTGGAVTIQAGLGGNTNGDGGELSLEGGVSSGSGTHGNVIIANTGGRVGVGTATPNAPFDVAGDSPGTVGGFASGALHITNPSALVNANAVITGHNSFGGNKQLWYLGSGSSSNDNITLINRQNGELSFATNNATRLTISSTGDIKLNAYPNTRDDGTPINILGTDASGNLISGPNEVIHIGGNFVDTTDQSISVVSTPQDITFNTNSLIDGISHTAGSATFTVNTSGVYNLIIAPQLSQGAGAATVEFWIEKNGTNIANSNVQETIGANSQSLPLLRWKERFVATDTFKIIWASDSTDTLLDNITSTYGGPNIPSIMLGVTQIGS